VASRLRLLLILTVATTSLLAVPARPAGAVLGAEEQAVLTLINEYRVANSLEPLSPNRQLNEAARWMSRDMAARDYVSHTDSLGREPFQRMASFGYTYNTWKGENIAAGIDSARTAFRLWKESPGHNSNMLNANYKVIGIARQYGEGTTYGWYWTTDFGGQGEPPPREPLPWESTPGPVPEPAQAPPLEPAPQVAAERTPEPVPTPELESAAKPARGPEPELAPEPPNEEEIASWVNSWLEPLALLREDSSVLTFVTYMAERYVTIRMAAFAAADSAGLR
jgi:uncharacterized protein YkwD